MSITASSITASITARRAGLLVAPGLLTLAAVAVAPAAIGQTGPGCIADPQNKSQIEHCEMVRLQARTKAQIEHDEQSRSAGGGQTAVTPGGVAASGAIPTPAPGWQLALSALVGGAVTAGGMTASRHLRSTPEPTAKA